MLRYFFLLYLLAAIGERSDAQSYSLVLHPAAGEDSAAIIKAARPPAPLNESAAILEYLRRLIPALQEEGYLAASLDSLAVNGNRYDAFLFLDKPYRWARLTTAALPPALLASAGITPGEYDGGQISPRRVARLSDKILTWCENNGYPFARVWLDSLAVGPDNSLSASVALDRGRMRRIDSITLEGNARIAPAFLSRYLDLYLGDPYDESKLRTLSPRLRELPFLREGEPWAVRFTIVDTRLTLNLQAKKANQLNALIGVLPNSTQNGGKLLLTADAVAAFQNILGYGENISVTYQNLQPRSPRLKADAIWPYLFDTPFGGEGHFDLFKRDRDFNRVTFQLGTRYYISATDYLRVYYENQSNRTDSVNLLQVRSTRQLPRNIDISANGGGAELQLSRLDYRLNPRKGFAIRAGGTVLARRIRRNNAIEEITDGTGFDYGTLYDSLESRRYQARLTADASYFIPLGRQAAVRIGYAGGYISGNALFQNELYQIGGFRLLRGFDEQSIFTNHYHLASLELRLLFSGNSNVYLFSDNAWVQSRFTGVRQEGLYNGFGVGASLETKNGLFNIGLGFGRSPQIDLKLRAAKIYFGYVAYF